VVRGGSKIVVFDTPIIEVRIIIAANTYRIIPIIIIFVVSWITVVKNTIISKATIPNITLIVLSVLPILLFIYYLLLFVTLILYTIRNAYDMPPWPAPNNDTTS
jgi:hypothetical protein